MKKVLLASAAALVASAGIAAAEATVNGYGFAGVTYTDMPAAGASKTAVAHKVRLEFKVSKETDNGIKLGAYVRLDASDSSAYAFTQERVEISSGGLSVRVGSTHGAAKTLGRALAYYGFNDGGVIGFDNNTTPLNDSGNNVLVQYTTGSFTVGIASDAGGNAQDIGVKYSAGNLTVGAGYGTTNGVNFQGSGAAVKGDFWMAAIGYNFGQGSVSVGIGEDSGGNQDIVGTLKYNVGSATTLGVAVESSDDNAETAYGLDVAYDLGGATLSGTVGKNGAGATVAGFGIFFGF